MINKIKDIILNCFALIWLCLIYVCCFILVLPLNILYISLIKIKAAFLQCKIYEVVTDQSISSFSIAVKTHEKSIKRSLREFNIKNLLLLLFNPTRSSYYQNRYHTYEIISINQLPFAISIHDGGRLSFHSEDNQYTLSSSLMELNLKRHEVQNKCLNIYTILVNLPNITEAGYIVNYNKNKLKIKFNLFDVFIDCPAHYAFDISSYFEDKVAKIKSAYKVYKRG